MKKLSAVLMATTISLSSFAEGYQVNLQSTKQTAMGHVGAALKLGAESMHFNPAGMVFMENAIDLSAGASFTYPIATFKSNGIKSETDNLGWGRCNTRHFSKIVQYSTYIIVQNLR